MTPLENRLRERAGLSGYSGGFVEHYLVPLIYPEELTSKAQIALATLVVAANAAIYGAVIARRRRRRG